MMMRHIASVSGVEIASCYGDGNSQLSRQMQGHTQPVATIARRSSCASSSTAPPDTAPFSR